MKQPVFSATGERIAQARRAAGLSRREIAEPLGLRLWDVEQIESGRSEPGDDLLRAIADLLSCSASWLRSGAAVVQLDEKRVEELDQREQRLAVREEEVRRREEELRLREAALAEAQEQLQAQQAAEAADPLKALPPEGWTIDALARLVASRGHAFPDRVEEWAATLAAMRNVAGDRDSLPAQLDALARDVFEPLLRRRGAA